MRFCMVTGKASSELSFGIDAEKSEYDEIKLRLRDAIKQLVLQGVEGFLCSCEYGIPLWTAEIILELKENRDLFLCIVMPYEEQATNWSEEIRDRFFAIHEFADQVVMLQTQYSDICYFRADMYMLDHADILLTDDEESIITREARRREIRVVMF